MASSFQRDNGQSDQHNMHAVNEMSSPQCVSRLGQALDTDSMASRSPAQRSDDFQLPPTANKLPSSQRVMHLKTDYHINIDSLTDRIYPLDEQLYHAYNEEEGIKPNRPTFVNGISSRITHVHDTVADQKTFVNMSVTNPHQQATNIIPPDQFSSSRYRGYVSFDPFIPPSEHQLGTDGAQSKSKQYPRTRTSLRNINQSSQVSLTNGLPQEPSHIQKQVVTSPCTNGHRARQNNTNRHNCCDDSNHTRQTCEQSQLDYKCQKLTNELRTRDLQLTQLRTVYDQNEIALLQVSEEKRLRWIATITELKKQFDVRLQTEKQLYLDEDRFLRRTLLKLNDNMRKLEEKVRTFQFEKEVCDRNYGNIQKELVRTKSMVDDLANKLAKSECNLVEVRRQLDEQDDQITQETYAMSVNKLDVIKQVKVAVPNSSTHKPKCYVRSYSGSQPNLSPQHVSTPEELDVAGKQSTSGVQFEDISPEQNYNQTKWESEKDRFRHVQPLSVEHTVSNTPPNKSSTTLTRHLSHIELASRAQHQKMTQFQSANNVSSNCQSSENVSSQYPSASNLSKQSSDGEQPWFFKKEIALLRSQLKRCYAEFEQEREQWTSEKNRVIAYQQTLQSAYIMMEHKNRTLEASVEALTTQLEYEKNDHL